MSKNLQQLAIAVPVGSLDSYITWANKIPLLTNDEEIELATRFINTGDLAAARKMVLSHMRYVISVARGYMGYGLALADLVQEGSIGLMKAVKRFDPTKGVRLVSFAVHWIKAEIHEFILKNWRIVKIAATKPERKLFFNLRKAKKEREWLNQMETQQLAEKLNVKESEVTRMEERLYSRDAAFDNTGSDDDDWSAPENYLEDFRFDPARSIEANDWTNQREGLLRQALTELDPRSLDILQQRWLNDNKMTLQDLAEKYQVSAERVRQLEKNAMLKVKSAIESVA
ncbi:MAG: RNA polymerase sigma factor RpoH [Pseudomonadota bacterium]|nr:RNA polymerase sigma factor RpoH [Pseudomonadota bacterium]